MKQWMQILIIGGLMACMSTAMILSPKGSPSSMFPYGFRPCYGVKTVGAAQGVVEVMEKIAKTPEEYTTDVGGAHHTLLHNGAVITRFDPVSRGAWGGKSALLIATDNPRSDAHEAHRILSLWGVKASIREYAGHENESAILESDAFDGWVMAFQKRATRENSPKSRMLTK